MSYKAGVTKLPAGSPSRLPSASSGQAGQAGATKPMPRGCYAAHVLILNVALRDNIVRAKRTATIPVFMV
jgi:hypothetical protein